MYPRHRFRNVGYSLVTRPTEACDPTTVPTRTSPEAVGVSNQLEGSRADPGRIPSGRARLKAVSVPKRGHGAP